MDIRIEVIESPPERAEMSAILMDLYTHLTRRLLDDGGPDIAPEVPAGEYWEQLEDFLPPRGQTALARNAEGRLVGCGTLTDLGDGYGELRRLYVRPEIRGNGLGRRLVEARMQAGRAMGLRTMLVDTLRANHEMQKLYDKMGFCRVPPYAQSGSVTAIPELAPYMIYYRMDL